jgi:hypothetical protein
MKIINSLLLTSLGWWEVFRNVVDLGISYPSGQRVFLQKIDNNSISSISTCYNYLSFHEYNNTQARKNTFCYPSIIITGHKKCSTSAMYQLLSQAENGQVDSARKENCLCNYDTLLDYFDSFDLPNGKSIHLLNGCIDVQLNVKMRAILRNPNTFYIVKFLHFLFYISV